MQYIFCMIETEFLNIISSLHYIVAYVPIAKRGLCK
jgi:hypothetical protein